MKKILLAFDDTPEMREALIQLGAHAADDGATFNDPDPTVGEEPNQKMHDAWMQVHNVIAVELAGMPSEAPRFEELDLTIGVPIGCGGVVEIADDRDGLGLMELRLRQDGKIERDFVVPPEAWNSFYNALGSWIAQRIEFGIKK